MNMKKQLKNRRSASSCSTYSQHSISLASLQPVQPLIREQKQKKLQFPQLQKQYLQLYTDIKKYTKSDQQPEKQTIAKWKQTLKATILQNRQYYRSLTHNIAALKLSMVQFEAAKQEEIKNIRGMQEEEIKVLEEQVSRKIMAVSGEFSRKEQEYKEIISKFIDTLHKSQRNWSKIYTQLSTRLKKAQDIFKQRLQIDTKNQQVYEQIANLTNQLCAQQDQSLGSINLSYDQMLVHAPLKLESRRNTIDISSIEEIYEDQMANQTRTQCNLQGCLIQLISWGFFLQRNQSNIRKLITLTKNLQNPQQITKQPIFPILVESIKLQLNMDKMEPSLESEESSELEEEGNRIVMRDIENQINV